jgi:phenylalanine ammonia-lyase
MITTKVTRVMHDTFESTSTMDAASRMEKIAASSTVILLDFFTGPRFVDMASAGVSLTRIPSFRANVASRATFIFEQLRSEYLTGTRGPAPASPYLNKTRPVYEFVRLSLGVRMHGLENLNRFAQVPGMQYGTVGQDVSLIHEVCSMSSLLSFF